MSPTVGDPRGRMSPLQPLGRGGRQSAVERSTPSEERQKLSGTPRLDSYLVGFGTRGGADSRLNTGQQPGAQALRRIVRLDPELNLGPLSFLLRQGPPQCDSRKDAPPLGCHDTARRHRAEQLRGHRPRQPRSGPTGPVSTRSPRRLDHPAHLQPPPPGRRRPGRRHHREHVGGRSVGTRGRRRPTDILDHPGPKFGGDAALTRLSAAARGLVGRNRRSRSVGLCCRPAVVAVRG